MTNDSRKSDSSVVPEKSPNDAGQLAEEAMEGRGLTKGNSPQQHASRTLRRVDAPNALERVRQAARRDRKMRFTALLHHVYDIARLRTAFFALKKDAAPGVDGETWQHYETNLGRNLQTLSQRLTRGAYRAKPVRRVYIPKADGRQRPLGVTALEDKVVQRATVDVMNAIYETDFLGFSYGFRPGRSQHQALDALYVGLLTKKVNWVLDVDIRAFFDTIDHGWLTRFLEHRIADRRIIRLIQKWLNAGVLEEGQRTRVAEGTPQGGSASPWLANVYLHYVFDLWVHAWRQKRAHGDVIVVRFADDSARPKPLLLRDERSPHHEYPNSVSSLGPGATGRPVPSKQDRHNVLEGSATSGVVRSPGTETNLQAAIAMNDRCAPVSVYPAVIAARAGTGAAEPPVVGRRLLSMVDEVGTRTHRGSRGEGGSMQGQSRGVRLETPPGPPMLAVATKDIRPEAEVPTDAWLGSRRGSYEQRRRVMPLEQRAPTSVTLLREGCTA
jgi:retron-type reverse transcriptase